MPTSKARQSRRKTPWDARTDRTATQEFLYQHYNSHYKERHPVLKTTGEELLINSYVPETCPYCESSSIKRDGHTKNGVQRFRCLACMKKFTPVTGTIIDGHKISISEWMGRMLLGKIGKILRRLL